jgi:hypothetical protein
MMGQAISFEILRRMMGKRRVMMMLYGRRRRRKRREVSLNMEEGGHLANI